MTNGPGPAPRRTRASRSLLHPATLLLLAGCAATPRVAVPLPRLARQVEIRRTEYGVPHILGENLRAAAFALAWVQLEDHGPGIIEGMNAARGRAALVQGERHVDADTRARQRHARAVETFPLLTPDTRDVYDGFAQGMNHFIRVHRAELPAWMEPDFTAYDVMARDIAWPSDAVMNRFRERMLEPAAAPPLLRIAENPDPGEQDPQNVGSNAWALHPSRTTSGRAILLRNPHLSWTAGYYEAHVRVPGTLDFYGDFRIGGPFTVIGGFNRYLGFATTNNANRAHEFYAFRLDPANRDAIVVDDVSRPLQRDTVAVEYRDDSGKVARATREYWSSEFGPVFHRDSTTAYVYRPSGNGEFRAGEQWLELMKAESLEEYRAAMRIQARETSNFTYADRDGNIFYTWVATVPRLPHPAGGDTLAIFASRTGQVWSTLVPFDSLPQLLNPPGGYIHNENNSPHYTNLNRILPHQFSSQVQAPSLSLRSQLALEILHNDRKFSLEDVIEAKHSMRMLLADRVKDDLVRAVRAAQPAGDVARALDLIVAWDNRAAADSRGAVLFETWWDRYRSQLAGRALHAVEWSEAEPASTPRGLADAQVAVDAFVWAVPETAQRYGSFDVAWGEFHRVRRGAVDVSVGGCGGALGCFRVLNFAVADDGKRVANGGDGWVIAVEFSDEPRAYSVLAYGQSPDPLNPYHADQAELFASNRLKPVRWTEADIEAHVVERYRPGEARKP